MLLDRIPASAEAWTLARANASARVFVGVRLDTLNRGLVLCTDLMSRLVNLGLASIWIFMLMRFYDNQQ